MTPRGAVTLRLDGREVRITGGPGEAEWRLDIPDFGVPDPAALRAVLAAMLAAMRERPDDAYHVGCRAGLGRTGMALACLAAMTGEDEPLRWVRRTYDPGAVETPAQEALVADFAGSGA